jgi:SAM-dependent MidA family methyltransferase
MDAALYDPEDGFYQRGGAAGRRRDFVTSPELGPLFAAVWARALDEWWEQLGHPDPYVVVEAGAGSGTLARDVLAARPACSPALRYVLVERSARLRNEQIGRLPLELPAFVLGPSAAASIGGEDNDDGEAETPHPLPGRGPMVTSLAELPALEFRGVIFANELLDNLPFDLLAWRESGWHEVRVAAADDQEDELVEMIVPAPAEVAAEAERLVHELPGSGSRIPMQREAHEWLREARALLEAGRVVVIDYADTTSALARSPWTTWLRTFRQHAPGLAPLERPGSQDITAVVAIDQLASVHSPTTISTQAVWLSAHGLDDLVAQARAGWKERAAVGDLEALRARSRIDEARALTDPDGLGAFRVLEWEVGSTSG